MNPVKIATVTRWIAFLCAVALLSLGEGVAAFGFLAAIVVVLQLLYDIFISYRGRPVVDSVEATPCSPALPDNAGELDPLTGLCNRRALESVGRRLFDDALAQQRPVSILMMDLDHFKKTNDLYGHPAGDAVLREFADVLRGKVREIDFVGRYGGEEFIMVLPGAPLAPAARLAERIRSITEEHEFPHAGGRLPVTVSIGVATAYPEERTTMERLIEASDKNLYRAKRAGRNRVMAGVPAKDDDE